VHIGTNNIGRKRSGEVIQELRELGWKLKARTDRVVISGLLPVPRDSEARNRERVQLNTWLPGWCRREGFRYLDNWTAFWGRWDLYKQDGLHLNQKGTNILGGRFFSTLRGVFKLIWQGDGIR
uniref:SGNH/GDSL hydrolase family protein n=1 Tax=Proteus mirabilis TaxID=584 RepID=UPI0016259AB3